MKIEETPLPGLLVFSPAIHRDDRGAFIESFNLRTTVAAGLPEFWAQDNFSISRKNVLRGLHYQIVQPQGKLVRVTHGSVIDVAVDIRRSSPTLGRYFAIELSADNAKMLWIPPGFAHGFLVLSDEAGFAYKVTDYYCAAGERTIAWNDPEIAIPWPVAEEELIISGKDRSGVALRDAELFLQNELALEDSNEDAEVGMSARQQKGSKGLPPPHQPREGVGGHKSLRSFVQSVKNEAERNAIALALEETGWNRKAAARLLKTSYRTVLYKIEQYRMSSSEISSLSNANESRSGKIQSCHDSRTNVSSGDPPRAASTR